MATDGGATLQGLAGSIDQLFKKLEASRAAAVAAPPAPPAIDRSAAPAAFEIASPHPASEHSLASGLGILHDPSSLQVVSEPMSFKVETIVGAPSSTATAPAPAPSATPLAAREREALATKLEGAVGAYLATSGSDRADLRAHILELSRSLEDAADSASVAVAVERLTLDGRLDDSDAVALANELLTPGVARAVAQRLGAAARDEVLRERRIRSVARLGDAIIVALGTALTESTERGPRRTYIDGMIALGDRALPIVEAMTLDTRWFVVRNAMRVLREVAGEKAVPHFTASLANDDARVRREALLSLAHVKGEDAAMLVHTKIADPDPEVRQAAAMACGELRAERAVRPMLEQLEHEDDFEVQTAILLALGQIGDPGAVIAIEKRAESGFFGRKAPTQVRVAAYRALAAIGTPHARKLVEMAATSDRDPDVRLAVARFPSKPPERTPAGTGTGPLESSS